jgi:hypothetical protein
MKRVLVLMILFSITTLSCVVYHPHMVDIPLIARKGDARLNAGISLMKYHATVSVGISDKIAIQTYGSTGGDHVYYVQQSVGYYKDLGNKKVMEVYSGFGYGYGDAYNDANPGDLYGNYQVYFSQFNIGKIGCKFANTDLGIALKAGYLHSKLTDNNYYINIFPPLPPEIFNYDCLLIEPQAILRLGGKKLKLCLQAGSTGIYEFTNKDKWFPYLHLNLGFGFNYRF